MYQRFKQIASYLTIILLLPYIITVFISGPSIVTSTSVESRQSSISVKIEEETVEMDLDEYGIGILAKEIPADYEEEALKAQAILARTDIYRKISENGSDVVLEESFWSREQMEEAWGVSKYSRYYNKMKKAWQETEGQVLTYEGKIAMTPFFRLSNGSTRDGEEVLGEKYPYLKIVECPLDIESAEQMRTVTLDDLDAEVTKCDTAGYVLNVQVGKETVSGEEFRKNYHLGSSCFSIQKYEGKIRITTRGLGHGLGMSQYTADKMAEEGSSYEEILKYFFEGTKLQEVVDIVQDNV